MWFVGAGDTPHLWNPCQLVLEDGTDLGELTTLAADLPIGYHRLTPVDGGPTDPARRASTRVHRRFPVNGESPRRSTRCGRTVVGHRRPRAISAVWPIGCTASGGRAILHQPPAPVRSRAAAGGQPLLPQQPAGVGTRCCSASMRPPPPELECRADQLIGRDEVWAPSGDALEALVRRHRPSPPPHCRARVAIWNALCDEFGPFWREWPSGLSRYDHDLVTARLRDDRIVRAASGVPPVVPERGRRPARRRDRDRVSRSSATWPSGSPPTAPTRGSSRTCSRSTCASARRPIRSTPMDRTGAFRRSSRGGCATRRYEPFIATIRSERCAACTAFASIT